MVRVPRYLDCTHLIGRSLLPWSNKVSTQPKFSIWMIKETLRDDSQIRIGDTKKYILMCQRVWCHEILIPCDTTALFLSIFFDLSSTTFEVSLFLCSSVRILTLVVLSSSFKFEEFLHEMAISCSELKSWTAKSIFPCELNWLNAQFSLFTLNLGYFPLSSLLWFHWALWSAFGLLRKFLHSPNEILRVFYQDPTISLSRPEQDCAGKVIGS